eukprot:SAG22_NODE_317_length_12513_cov_41.467214_14_plen_122_part_00
MPTLEGLLGFDAAAEAAKIERGELAEATATAAAQAAEHARNAAELAATDKTAAACAAAVERSRADLAAKEQAVARVGETMVSSKALSFCRASTRIVSKTVPFLAVSIWLSLGGNRPGGRGA